MVPSEREMDDGLRFLDRLDLTFVVVLSVFCAVMSVANLTILKGLPSRVEQRIVGSLDPDLAIALGDALEFTRLIFAPPQRCPELAVFRAVTRRRVDEDAVMLALDFVQAVADGSQEILVGGQNDPVQIEFDQRL